MEDLLPYFVLIIFSLFLALSIVAYRKSKVRFIEELDIVAKYHEQCGGRFGFFNWTIPFVRISVYDDFAAILCWNFKIILKKGDVQRLVEKGLFSSGVQIIHNRNDIPQKLIIWTRNLSKLKQALESSLL
jgi:hypothetical protein